MKIISLIYKIDLFAQNLFEQTANSVLRTLTRMLKEDIKKVKDQGKLFERLSSDYDIGKSNLKLIYSNSFM